jgi:hypothetical protein
MPHVPGYADCANHAVPPRRCSAITLFGNHSPQSWHKVHKCGRAEISNETAGAIDTDKDVAEVRRYSALGGALARPGDPSAGSCLTSPAARSVRINPTNEDTITRTTVALNMA